MELIDNIKKYLNRSFAVDIIAFNTLNCYNDKNKECLNLINVIADRIKDNLKCYEAKPEDAIYNVLENDFFTLKELVKEYEENEYVLFPLRPLSIYSMLNKEDIMLVSKLMLDIESDPFKHLVEVVRNNLNEEDLNRFNENPYSVNNIEKYINVIKNKIGGYYYFEVLASYLNYEFRCEQNV